MLHRALRYALVPFAPTPPGLLHPRSLYPNQSSQIDEASMEVALKASSGPETLSSTQQQEEAAWAVERSALLGDEFSVDDLLDFGGLTDIEQEEGGGGEEEEEEVEEKEAQPEPMEADNPNSSCSSALSFEQTPPSEIALPTDYVAELEWVSHFVDESFADFPLPCSAASLFNPTAKKPQAEFSSFAKRTAACMLSTDAPVPVQAKRSKRSRARRWLRSVPTPFPEPASSASSSSSSSSSISPSCVLLWASRSPVREKPKKKRGRKPKAATQRPAASALGVGGVGDRRCSHCGAQKTPQWRAGPEGPKTLCNACGVRFKSGRLLPEYRPACSPTFLSHAHSNSHRKVLEMRRKKAELGLLPPSPPPVSSP